MPEFPDLPPELTPPEGIGNLPAFQDLGSLLAPTAGPINWEVARQVAVWVATSGEPESAPDRAASEMLEELVRLSELRVSEYTGLSGGAHLGQVVPVNRTGWIEGNIPGFRYLLDKLAERMSQTMKQDSVQSNPLEAMIEPMMPIIFGAQIGVLLGYSANRILGQFDILLPRTDGNRIYMVVPNLDSLAESYELDRREFFLWVSMHEVTHQVEFGIPWMRRHFTRLVERAIAGVEVDPNAIGERLSAIDLTDQASMERLFADPAGLLGIMFKPPDEERLIELQALMSVLEGYAEHVMDEAARGVVPSVPQMREVLSRRRVERSASERLLERLMGLDVKRKQYIEGEEFCRSIVEAGGIDLLNRIWDGPELLPTLDEIRMPQMWQLRVERVVG